MTPGPGSGQATPRRDGTNRQAGWAGGEGSFDAAGPRPHWLFATPADCHVRGPRREMAVRGSGSSPCRGSSHGPLMGARGRVASRARRPARVGASTRALARRRSAAPYAVVAAVGRDASFRTTTDRARRGGAESKFDPLVSSAHARAAWKRSGRAPRVRSVVARASRRVATRPAGACAALPCTLARCCQDGRAGGRGAR